MIEDTAITSVACPGCSVPLDVADDEKRRCSNCGWRGNILAFRPLQLKVDAGQAALPEDATCVHHPAKRAESICAGTGDYICALCTIEHEGQTFSADYFSSSGAATAAAAFERTLARPDSSVVLYMGLCLIPYVNVIWLIGWPVWVVRGWIKLAHAAQLRREDPILRRLVSRARLIFLSVIFAIVTLLLVVFTFIGILALIGLWTNPG